MTVTPPATGRRERNKQQKLDRIVAAASELFAERGVGDVTTQQIADRADIGTGTLFLYAKTKGELLLLVQNAHYEAALATGSAAAAELSEPVDAVLAILEPIIACNRAQIENGRTYLREMMFGDPEEPRHAEALAIVDRTEDAVAAILRGDASAMPEVAQVLARAISAVMFVTMAASINTTAGTDEIVATIREQVRVLLAR